MNDLQIAEIQEIVRTIIKKEHGANTVLGNDLDSRCLEQLIQTVKNNLLNRSKRDTSSTSPLLNIEEISKNTAEFNRVVVLCALGPSQPVPPDIVTQFKNAVIKYAISDRNDPAYYNCLGQVGIAFGCGNWRELATSNSLDDRWNHAWTRAVSALSFICKPAIVDCLIWLRKNVTNFPRLTFIDINRETNELTRKQKEAQIIVKKDADSLALMLINDQSPLHCNHGSNLEIKRIQYNANPETEFNMISENHTEFYDSIPAVVKKVLETTAKTSATTTTGLKTTKPRVIPCNMPIIVSTLDKVSTITYQLVLPIALLINNDKVIISGSGLVKLFSIPSKNKKLDIEEKPLYEINLEKGNDSFYIIRKGDLTKIYSPSDPGKQLTVTKTKLRLECCKNKADKNLSITFPNGRVYPLQDEMTIDISARAYKNDKSSIEFITIKCSMRQPGNELKQTELETRELVLEKNKFFKIQGGEDITVDKLLEDNHSFDLKTGTELTINRNDNNIEISDGNKIQRSIKNNNTIKFSINSDSHGTIDDKKIISATLDSGKPFPLANNTTLEVTNANNNSKIQFTRKLPITATIENASQLNVRSCSCGTEQCAAGHRLSAWDPSADKKINLISFVASAIKDVLPIKTNSFVQGMYYAYLVGLRDDSDRKIRKLSIEKGICENEECQNPILTKEFEGAQCPYCRIAKPKPVFRVKKEPIVSIVNFKNYKWKAFIRCGDCKTFHENSHCPYCGSITTKEQWKKPTFLWSRSPIRIVSDEIPT